MEAVEFGGFFLCGSFECFFFLPAVFGGFYVSTIEEDGLSLVVVVVSEFSCISFYWLYITTKFAI